MSLVKQMTYDRRKLISKGIAVILSTALFLAGTLAPLAEAKTVEKTRNFWASRGRNFKHKTHPVVDIPRNSVAPVPSKTPNPPLLLPQGAERVGELSGPKGLEPWRFRNRVIPSFTIFQDAHGNPVFQKNLSEIICRLSKENSRTPLLIAVEGAWGNLDLSWWKRLPNSIKGRWANQALASAWITGEEHAALTLGEKQIHLVGVDDPILHERNSNARVQVEKFRGTLPLNLKLAEIQLLSLAKKNWPDSMIRWDKLWSDFDRGNISVQQLAQLARPTLGRGWDTQRFPQASFLSELGVTSSPLNDKAVEKLITNISTTAPSLTLALGELNNSKQTPEKLLASMIQTVEGFPSNGETRALLKHLTQQQTVLRAQDFLKSSTIWEELNDLRSQGAKWIVHSQKVSPQGEHLLSLLERTRLAQKLIGLEMTPDEWDSYNKMEGRGSREDFILDLTATVPAFNHKYPPLSFEEKKAWNAADLFYDLAVERNLRMVEGALAEANSHGADRIILVAGGFHSPGMNQLMRERGTPYQIFSPHFSDSPQCSPTLRGESLFNSAEGKTVLVNELRGLDELDHLFIEGPIPNQLKKLFSRAKLTPPMKINGQEFILLSIKSGSWWSPVWMPIIIAKTSEGIRVLKAQNAFKWVSENARQIESPALLKQINSSLGREGSKLINSILYDKTLKKNTRYPFQWKLILTFALAIIFYFYPLDWTSLIPGDFFSFSQASTLMFQEIPLGANLPSFPLSEIFPLSKASLVILPSLFLLLPFFILTMQSQGTSNANKETKINMAGVISGNPFDIQNFLKSELNSNRGLAVTEYYLNLTQGKRTAFIKSAGPILAGRLYNAILIHYRNAYIARLQERAPFFDQLDKPETRAQLITSYEQELQEINEIRTMAIKHYIPRDFALKEEEIGKITSSIELCLSKLKNYERVEDARHYVDFLKKDNGYKMGLQLSRPLNPDKLDPFDLCPYLFHGRENSLFVILFEIEKSLTEDLPPAALRDTLSRFHGARMSADFHSIGLEERWLLPANLDSNEWNGKKTPISTNPETLTKMVSIVSETLNRSDYPAAIIAVPSEGIKAMALSEIERVMKSQPPEKQKELYFLHPENLESIEGTIPYVRLMDFINSASDMGQGSVLVVDFDRIATHLNEPRLKEFMTVLFQTWQGSAHPLPILFITSERTDRGRIDHIDLLEIPNTLKLTTAWINAEIKKLEAEHGVQFDQGIPAVLTQAINNTDLACTIENAIDILQRAAAQAAIQQDVAIGVGTVSTLISHLPSRTQLSFGNRVRAATARGNNEFNKEVNSLYSQYLQRGETDGEKAILRSRIEHLIKLEHMFALSTQNKPPPLTPHAIQIKLEFAKKRLNSYFSRFHDTIGKVIDTYYRTHLENRNNASSKPCKILCLVGDPGAGKTTLCERLGEVMDFGVITIKCSSLKDASSINGDDHTFLGAQPSQITVGLQKTGKNKNLIIFDEVDKISNDGVFNAMLHVLDGKFHKDAYVGAQSEIPLNKGEVETLFICTANSLDRLKSDPRFQALLDRMEIYHVRSYDQEDMGEIGEKHFLPEVIDKLVGLITIENKRNLLTQIVQDYLPVRPFSTRELRRLLRQVGSYVIHLHYINKPLPTSATSLVRSALGPPPVPAPISGTPIMPGQATGLAVRGEDTGLIIQVQTTISEDSQKPTLQVTGLLGSDMKESFDNAYELVSEFCQNIQECPPYLKNAERIYNKIKFSINIPNYEVTKDGPSAGVTFYTSLISALTGRLVRKNIAMTGEVDTFARVKKIGGLKHKVLAAKQNGFSTIIVPNDNFNDLIDEVMPASPEFHGLVEYQGKKYLFTQSLPAKETNFKDVFKVNEIRHGYLLEGLPNQIDSWLVQHPSFLPPMTYICVNNVHDLIHYALEEASPPTKTYQDNSKRIYELGSILLLFLLVGFIPDIIHIFSDTGIIGFSTDGLFPAFFPLLMTRWREPELKELVVNNPNTPTNIGETQNQLFNALDRSPNGLAYLISYWMARNPNIIIALLDNIDRRRSFFARIAKALLDSPVKARSLEIALMRVAAAGKRMKWNTLRVRAEQKKGIAESIIINASENKRLDRLLSQFHEFIKILLSDKETIRSSLTQTSEKDPEYAKLKTELDFHEDWIKRLESVVPPSPQENVTLLNRIFNFFSKTQSPGNLSQITYDEETLLAVSREYVVFQERRIHDLSLEWPEKRSKPLPIIPDKALENFQSDGQFFLYIQALNALGKHASFKSAEGYQAMTNTHSNMNKNFFLNETTSISRNNYKYFPSLSDPSAQLSLFETLERSGPRVLRLISDSKEARTQLPEAIARTYQVSDSTPLGKTSEVYRLDLSQLDTFEIKEASRIIRRIARILRSVENAVLVLDTAELSKFTGHLNIDTIQMILDVASSPSDLPSLPVIFISSTVDDTYIKDNATLYDLASHHILSPPEKTDFDTQAARLSQESSVAVESEALSAIHPILTDCRSYDLAMEAMRRSIAAVRETEHPTVTKEGLVNALAETQEQKRINLTKLERYEEAIAAMPDEAARFIGFSELGRLRRTREGSQDYTRIVSFLDVITGWPYQINYPSPEAGISWENHIYDRLQKAEKILDENLFGLEDVKRQLMLLLSDHLDALSKGRKPDPIRLCLVGDSGSGKTSIAPVIAKIFDVPFINIPCGGIKDDQILTGHRRVYVGSKPGEPVLQIIKVGTRYVVMNFDEAFKMPNPFPFIGLTDPDHSHIDNYTELEHDLSETIIVVTANHFDQIPPAIKDRMKVIVMNPPDQNKIIEAAVQMTLPALLKQKGLSPQLFGDSDERRTFLRALVKGYLPEISFRRLEQSLSNLLMAISNDPRFLQWTTEMELGQFFSDPANGMTKTPSDIIPSLARAFLGQTEILTYAGFLESAAGKNLMAHKTPGKQAEFKVTESDLERYLGPPRLIREGSTGDLMPGESIALIHSGQEIKCQAKKIKNSEEPDAPFQVVFPRERPLIPANPETGQSGNKIKVEGYQEILRICSQLVNALIPAETGLGKKLLFHTAPTTPVGGEIGHAAVMAMASALLERGPLPGTAFLGEPTLNGDLLPVTQLETTLMRACMTGNIQRYQLPTKNKEELTGFLSAPGSINAWGTIEENNGTWTIVFPSVHLRDLSPSAQEMLHKREIAIRLFRKLELSKNSFGMEDGIDNGMANAFTLSGTKENMEKFIKDANFSINTRYILVDSIAQSYSKAFPQQAPPSDPRATTSPQNKERGFISLEHFGPVFFMGLFAFGLLPLAYMNSSMSMGALFMALVGFASAGTAIWGGFSIVLKTILKIHENNKKSAIKDDLHLTGTIAGLARWGENLNEPERSSAKQLVDELLQGKTKMTAVEIDRLAATAIQGGADQSPSDQASDQMDQQTAKTFLAQLASIAKTKFPRVKTQKDQDLIPFPARQTIDVNRIRQINTSS